MIEEKSYINLFVELCKVKITFFVAISTSVGYILHSGSLSWEMLIPALGVFILASGSSALNEYQERDLDAIMERTKHRPIPSGLVSGNMALGIAVILLVSGSAIIYFSSNLTSLLLGILAFVWYNLIYTPLKRRYAMAVVPGSLIGAIPPVIGWTASGGNPFDLQIITVALFFFIWQIPHFWLLLLIHGNDYATAGFPTLTKIFSKGQLSRITFIWIVALAVSGLLIPIFNIASTIYSLIAMIIVSIWLLIDTKGILTHYLEKINFRRAFISVNLYVLAIIVIISIDKLLLNEF
ncbi:MAG: protoheme IX farnesyltransferase [Melioribacteraceae bacterium]|nr:protoheme IX farnesyltransferase [Melioribacteraceae bacterium]